MCEFTSLERCAAYVAARATLEAVQRASGSWPVELAEQAQRAALDTVHVTAVAVTYDFGTKDRRSCLRDAIACAVAVGALVDAAASLGFHTATLGELRHQAGRSVAMLAMFLHANTTPVAGAT